MKKMEGIHLRWKAREDNLTHRESDLFPETILVSTAAASFQIKNDAPRARALRAVRQWIADGVLAPGEALPPERDICAKLGVGLGTIQRVLRLLEDEGTVVKHDGRTRTIAQASPERKGVLHDSVVVLADWAEPFPKLRAPGWSLYITAGVLRALGEIGLHAVVVAQPQGRDDGHLKRLLTSHPTGLVIPEADTWRGDSVALAQQAQAAGVAVVVFSDEPGCEAFDRVEPDHETGAYELTRWLLARGKRNIRQIWPFSWEMPWVKRRWQGYERAMREAGLEPFPAIRSEQPHYTTADPGLVFRSQAQATAGALAPFVLGAGRTDALLAANDGAAAAVSAAIRLLGKTPNVDIEVVGYDDFWEESPDRKFESAGPLATVDKNNLECGRQLVSLLLERIEKKLPPEPQLRFVNPTLRVLV